MQVLEQKVLLVESAIAHLHSGGNVVSKRHGFKIVLYNGFYYLEPVGNAPFKRQKFNESQVRAFLHMVRNQAPMVTH